MPNFLIQTYNNGKVMHDFSETIIRLGDYWY